MNILLVDDQPAKLLSYEVILSELGENLIKASSAREALEALLKVDVGVILVDVCMPELDGFELAALIREHPRFQQTSIIFVSAIQIADPDRLRGYAAGAVDYVPVPVVPEVLRAKVKVFAELHRKTRELERLNRELETRVAERTAALEASTAQLQRLNEELEGRIEARTREREQALAQLFEAQKLDTIGQLTGGVAHDFNNLLMAVLGSLQLLRKRVPDDPRTLRLLENAVQGAERGAALTQRLLAFARRQELKPAAVDLAGLVRGMEDLLKGALGPGVRIVKSIPRGLAPLEVDANQLELALLNLVVNARDAMPQGGTLTLSADEPEGGSGRPRDLVRGDYVRICVADTGTGMDPATLARAVEPFFTTKGPGKGTGLGLSMVQGLAAQSGGALEVASEPGLGTTISLWLPRAGASVAAIAPAAREVGPERAQPRTVLVVDDDPLVSTGTAAMLEDLGHSVVEAGTAADALAVLQSNRPIDLVITDHAMPVMTGMELARRIRQAHPDLPIVLATGYAELAELGDDDLRLPRLSKPYRQEHLAAVIAGLSVPSLQPDVALG
ncbi:MAG: response regulator [Methylobacteriaceae bacterium]|nr:response regulator [Methylobacteriaceae bacterium]